MNDKKPIAVLGTGGHGRALADFLTEYGSMVVHLDDDPRGHPVVGGSEKLKDEGFLSDHHIVIGIGDCKLRTHFSFVTLRGGGILHTVRHPRAIISKTALLGLGCQYFPGAIVGVHVKVGNFVVINNNAVVAHDCIIKDGSQIADSATLAGGVIIGEQTLIGCGAVVLPKIRIGAGCIIGAGAVVTKNVHDNSVVKGNPAK